MKKIILLATLTILLASFATSLPFQNFALQGQNYQYNYNANAAGYGYNYATSYMNRPNYYGGYNSYPPVYYGARPALASSTSCNLMTGCASTHVSHMYIRNALDYTYYSNPRLFEPRYIDNNQRYYRGARPQSFFI